MNRTNIANPEFEYDAEDPEGFRSGHAPLRAEARRQADRDQRL